MFLNKIEQVLDNLLHKYQERQDLVDKLMYDAELDLVYDAVSDYAVQKGITFEEAEREIYRMLNEDEVAN